MDRVTAFRLFKAFTMSLVPVLFCLHLVLIGRTAAAVFPWIQKHSITLSLIANHFIRSTLLWRYLKMVALWSTARWAEMVNPKPNVQSLRAPLLMVLTRKMRLAALVGC